MEKFGCLKNRQPAAPLGKAKSGGARAARRSEDGLSVGRQWIGRFGPYI
jgi:hypothetical protein